MGYRYAIFSYVTQSVGSQLRIASFAMTTPRQWRRRYGEKGKSRPKNQGTKCLVAVPASLGQVGAIDGVVAPGHEGRFVRAEQQDDSRYFGDLAKPACGVERHQEFFAPRPSSLFENHVRIGAALFETQIHRSRLRSRSMHNAGRNRERLSGAELKGLA